MYIYKDFDYVNYILNLPVDDGLSFYFKCVERTNDKIRKIDDDRLWQAYIQGGKEGQTFEDYKLSVGYNPTKEGSKKHKNFMTNDEKIIEEQRIKNNVMDLRKIIEEKDKKMELNKISNEIIEGGKH